MKEIGGYFGLESMLKSGGEYYKRLVSLNTARNALVYGRIKDGATAHYAEFKVNLV